MGVYGIQNKIQGMKRMSSPYAVQADETTHRDLEAKGLCHFCNLALL